jgi:hypothetical protein
MSEKNEILENLLSSVKNMTDSEYDELYRNSLERESIRIVTKDYDIRFSYGRVGVAIFSHYSHHHIAPIYVGANEPQFAAENTYSLVA